MEILFASMVALSVTMVLIPPLAQLAQRMQVIDWPAARKVHGAPVPKVGGIAMIAGALLALALWLEPTRTSWAMVAGVFVLAAVGVWDDRVGLSYRAKFAAQTAAVLIVMIFGDVGIDTINLVERVELPSWVSWPLTFLFLLGVTNAINLADGLDGLAGGTILLSFSALALLALSVGNGFVATLTVVAAGSVLGFLRFNTYPARVFMGDAGSGVLGFTVATASVLLTQDVDNSLSATLPLLLLAVPIIDTLTVMVQRIRDGRSPFVADRNHLHHRLLNLGLDHHEAVVTIYLAQIAFTVTAWFMRYESDLLIVAVFTIAAVVLSAVLLRGARHLRRQEASASIDTSGYRLGPIIRRLAASERAPSWATRVVVTGLAVYPCLTFFGAAVAERDINALAAVTAVALVAFVALRRARGAPRWGERAALYVGAVLFVYADLSSAPRPEWITIAQWILFPALVAGVAFHLRFSPRRFNATSLDVIVLFLALIIPNLPGSVVLPEGFGIGVAKVLVLFYAIETALWRDDRSANWVSGIGAVMLLTLAIRGLLG